MGIAFMVGTESFTLMVSGLGAMPTWSVLAAPASRKVQSILENRAFRGQAWNMWNCGPRSQPIEEYINYKDTKLNSSILFNYQAYTVLVRLLSCAVLFRFFIILTMVLWFSGMATQADG